MTNFKKGDHVIATAAADKHYKVTREGWIGRVLKGNYKDKEGNTVVDVESLGNDSPLPFMSGSGKYDLRVSCLKKIVSPAEYFLKEGVTDKEGKLTEAGKERMLATVFEVASDGIYKSAMRGALAAKKAERDLKKLKK